MRPAVRKQVASSWQGSRRLGPLGLPLFRVASRIHAVTRVWARRGVILSNVLECKAAFTLKEIHDYHMGELYQIQRKFCLNLLELSSSRSFYLF